MRKLTTLMVFLSLIGCTHMVIPKDVQLPVLESPQAENLLFPYGSYLHIVDLKIFATKKSEERSFSFQGVAETSIKKIQLVVLSPFHTTLMKITEDRMTSKMTIEAYDDRIKAYQDRLTDYYLLMREITLLSKTGETDPMTKTLDFADKRAQVTLSKMKNGVPQLIEIESAHFAMKIKVESLRGKPEGGK